jgi:hypothetical protein
MTSAAGALPPKDAHDGQGDQHAQENQETELLGAGGKAHEN